MDEERDTDAAERLLSRLGEFAAGLSSEERALFAVLVGPGITALHADAFRWEPGSLRARLTAAVATSGWHIVERS